MCNRIFLIYGRVFALDLLQKSCLGFGQVTRNSDSYCGKWMGGASKVQGTRSAGVYPSSLHRNARTIPLHPLAPKLSQMWSWEWKTLSGISAVTRGPNLLAIASIRDSRFNKIVASTCLGPWSCQHFSTVSFWHPIIV